MLVKVDTRRLDLFVARMREVQQERHRTLELK
jgi:hypothetical protein